MLTKNERLVSLFFSIAVALVGGYCLYALINLPADPKNSFLLGFSLLRLAAVALIALPTLLCLGLAIALARPQEKRSSLAIKTKSFLSNRRYFATALVVFLVLFLVSKLASLNLPGEAASVSSRLFPLALFFSAFFGFLSLVTLWFGQVHIKKSIVWFSNLSLHSLSLASAVVVFTLIAFPVTFYQTGERARPDSVPFKEPIGYDLDWEMNSSKFFLENGYIGQDLPFNLFVFAPFLQIDFTIAYKIFAAASFASFLFAVSIFPRLVLKDKNPLFTMALFGAGGLFSYGVQFEIEQGQYNLIVFAFSLIAIYLFHFHKRLRPFAYLFYSIALQMKLWPGIFILMLVEDWRDWKTNFRRLGLLLLSNLAAFFMLGPKFLGFFSYVSTQFIDHIGPQTHSIEGWLVFSGRQSEWIAQNYGVLNIALFALLGLCLLAILYKAIKENEKGVNPYLFFGCVIAAMLVPTLSNDYKIPMLITPAIVYLSAIIIPKKFSPRALNALFVFLIVAGVWITFFSFVIKPPIMQNNMPVLMAILVMVTISYFIIPGKKRLRR